MDLDLLSTVRGWGLVRGWGGGDLESAGSGNRHLGFGHSGAAWDSLLVHVDMKGGRTMEYRYACPHPMDNCM